MENTQEPKTEPPKLPQGSPEGEVEDAQEIEKNLQTKPFPQTYFLKTKCRIRADKDLDSKEIKELAESTAVSVEEISGRRARISEPVAGWMSWRLEQNGKVLLTQDEPTKQLQQVGESVLLFDKDSSLYILGKILSYNDKLGLFHILGEHTRKESWMSPDGGRLKFLGPGGLNSLTQLPPDIIHALHPRLKEQLRSQAHGMPKDDRPSRNYPYGQAPSYGRGGMQPGHERNHYDYMGGGRGNHKDPQMGRYNGRDVSAPHMNEPFNPSSRAKDEQAMLETYMRRRMMDGDMRNNQEHPDRRIPREPPMREPRDPRDPRIPPDMRGPVDPHDPRRHEMHEGKRDHRRMPDDIMRGMQRDRMDPRMDPRRDPRGYDHRLEERRRLDPRMEHMHGSRMEHDPRYDHRMRGNNSGPPNPRDPRGRGDPDIMDMIHDPRHSSADQRRLYEYYLNRKTIEAQRSRYDRERGGRGGGMRPGGYDGPVPHPQRRERKDPMGREKPRHPGFAPGEKQLIILRGFPGAGKTMLAKQITERFGGHTIICSEDRYHWTGGDVGVGTFIFKPEINWQTRDWCAREVIDALREGVQLVVVDNINYRIIHYEEHVRAAHQLGYTVKILEIVHDPDLIPKFRARCKLNLAEEEWLRLRDKWETDPRVQLLYPAFTKDERQVQNGGMPSPSTKI